MHEKYICHKENLDRTKWDNNHRNEICFLTRYHQPDGPLYKRRWFECFMTTKQNSLLTPPSHHGCIHVS